MEVSGGLGPSAGKVRSYFSSTYFCYSWGFVHIVIIQKEEDYQRTKIKILNVVFLLSRPAKTKFVVANLFKVIFLLSYRLFIFVFIELFLKQKYIAEKLITINLLLFSIWHTIAREKQREKFFVGLGQGVWLMSYWKLFAKINPSLYTTPRENLILLREGRCTIKMFIQSPLITFFSVGSNQQ